MNARKPLGGRAYGSIPHLPGSRRGPGDYGLEDAQAAPFLAEPRRGWTVVVQEKLDGSNVCAAHHEGQIVALTRAGYLAESSPYAQHHAWARFVRDNEARFGALLAPGERACGEWMILAHGTRYVLPHEPFVLFDLRRGHGRESSAEVTRRAGLVGMTTPREIHRGGPMSIADAVARLDDMVGRRVHRAVDPPEGCVWRIERDRQEPMVAKWVRSEKVDGCYLAGVGASWSVDIWNTWAGGWTP